MTAEKGGMYTKLSIWP